MDRVALSWSGGKDAALALFEARRDPEVEVVELLTTASAANGRSSIHGVRRELMDRQTDALGLPVKRVELPDPCSNEEYAAIMADVVADYESRDVDRMGFGDLFLSDVRAYREERLADTALSGYWPIWGRPTADLAIEVIDAGFEAMLACVDGSTLRESFAGRAYDRTLLQDLPDEVDPCGENGEFHTFVHGGPIFESPVEVTVGETVTREVGENEFHYADLLSADVKADAETEA